MRAIILAGLALAAAPADAAKRHQRDVPANVIAELKAAATQGNVYSVTGDKQFPGKILKADTIVFTSKSILRMTGGYPYVAIVARRVLVGAPDEQFTIIASPGKAPYPPSPKPPHPGTAPNGPDNGAHGGVGGPGANGRDGANGFRGSDGRRAPTLYILANQILRQDGTVPPTFADVSLDTQGQDGQAGQAAQDGQNGGRGGSGGASVFDGNPFNGGGCKIPAGSGGPGGKAGHGGTGGNGGYGGRGGDIYYGGSQVVMDLFSFAKVTATGGSGAIPGAHGREGTPGLGGPRGAWNGTCHGGSQGANAQPDPRSHTNRPGEDADGGLVYYAPMDTNALFPGSKRRRTASRR